MTVEIPLSQGKVAVIDAADFLLVGGYRWYAIQIGTNCYAITKNRKKLVYMHRLILGAKPEEMIDHRDRNGLNNRRSNLRFCTLSQNAANARPRTQKSGYRGVAIFPNKQGDAGYQARVMCEGKIIFGPWRDRPILAAIDYDRLAFEHFGEFATLNFPLELTRAA